MHANRFGRFGRWSSKLLALASVGLLASLGGVSQVHAEGSRSMFPSGILGARAPMDTRTDALYAGVVRNRTFVYVYAEANQYILVGSRNRANGGDIFIYNPQSFGTRGDETVPGAANYTCSAASAGANFGGAGRGIITTRASELAGPNSANNVATVASGWSPCAYQAPTTGIYGVRFTGATSGTSALAVTAASANPQILANEVAAWEVQVRSSAANSLADINGRVFTYAWVGRTGGNGVTARLNHILFYITQDGYRYRQRMNGIDPFAYSLYGNAQGFIDGGDPLYKSVRGTNQTASVLVPPGNGITAQQAQYPIFFSDVSPGGANAAQINTVLGALGIATVPPVPQVVSVTYAGDVGGTTSSFNNGGTFTFETINTLSFEIVISRNGVDFDPANPLNKVLSGTALTGIHNEVWDGRDNAGTPFPVGAFLYRMAGRNGEVHFPIIDTEGLALGGPTITQLNGSLSSTVYFDDRGYVTSNATAVGELNGHLCGAGHLQVQPTPNQSLAGVDSSDGNLGGSGFFYRRYPQASIDGNVDCQNSAADHFGTAKGLDTWAFESTAEIEQSLTIVLADMDAVFGPIPSVVSPGQLLTGLVLTCNNAGPDPAVQATCVPTVDVGVISNVICSPATPVASLPNGSAISCTFDYTAPGVAGGSNTAATSVLFTGTASALNDSLLTNNVDTSAATVIDALNDDFSASPIAATVGGTTASVFGNDTTGAAAAAAGNVAVSLTNNGGLTGASIAANGIITVPPGTAAGTYVLTYQICDLVLGTVCDTATATVVVAAADMAATLGPVPAVVSPGQSLTGLTLSCANVGTLTATSATCVPTADVGTVSNVVCAPVPPINVAAGNAISCTYDYLAPGTAGGTNTAAQTLTITGTTGATNDGNAANNVDTDAANIIDAVNDDFSASPVDATLGGTTASVFGNDSNGAAAAAAGNVAVSLTNNGGLTGATIGANGIITVPAGSTPGTYVLTYQICDLVLGTVCDTATATVVVAAADMAATLGPVPAVVSPGQSLTGLTLSCANVGTSTATAATCVPTADV
ncbi:MAG: hypothetical protein ACT4NL_01590, partial [Pseudomarimonas sp.]